MMIVMNSLRVCLIASRVISNHRYVTRPRNKTHKISKVNFRLIAKEEEEEEEVKRSMTRSDLIVNFVTKTRKEEGEEDEEENERIVCADVGCGHGTHAIRIGQNKNVYKCFGIDKSVNEIDYAKRFLKSLSLSEDVEQKIEFKIGDGLDEIDIEKERVRTIVLSGMGTKSIIKILKRAGLTNDTSSSSVRTLVLNPPAGELVDFRKWLWRNGWHIVDEALCVENECAHVVLKAQRRASSENQNVCLQQQQSILDLWLGNKLKEQRNDSNVILYAKNRRDYAKEMMMVKKNSIRDDDEDSDSDEIDYRKAFEALEQFLDRR